MAQRWAIVAILAFVGCESVRNTPPVTQPASPVAAPPVSHAIPERVVIPITNPVPITPPAVVPAAAQVIAPPLVEAQDDPLTRAADCMAKGDQAAAARHLEVYVREHPGQLMFRVQLAELLVRVGRDDAAKVHFERFAADARRATGPPKDHLVHAHTRLLEISRREGDEFGEAFHRGVGLLELLKELEATPNVDETFREETLCQALKALTEARAKNPQDAATRAFLAEVYERAGNRRAAETERIAVRTAVVPAGLPVKLHE